MNNTTGDRNLALGESAGSSLTTGSNNIYVGSSGGSAGESNRIRIGTVGTQKNAFIAGIFGVTVSAGIPVNVDSNGRLGTTTSSKRFKEAIKPMDKTSEAILALEPVTFQPQLRPVVQLLSVFAFRQGKPPGYDIDLFWNERRDERAQQCPMPRAERSSSVTTEANPPPRWATNQQPLVGGRASSTQKSLLRGLLAFKRV